MDEESNDVKQPVEGSSPETRTATAEQQPDVKTETPSSGEEKSLLEAVQGALEKHGEEDSQEETELEEEATEEGEEADESAASDASKAEEAEKKEDVEQKEEPPSVEQDLAKLPLGQQKRFKEVIQQKNDAEAKLKQAEPFVQQAQAINNFCQANRIGNQQLVEALEVVALLNTAPQKGVAKLREMLEALEVYSGEKLPADLAKRVADGTIDEAAAKEIAQLRAERKTGELQSAHHQQTSIQAQQQALVQAVNSFVTAKQKIDPDFQPSKNGRGKWEFVNDRFIALLQEKQPRTPEQITSLAEQAYNEVNTAFSRFRPKPEVKKVLPASRGSSPNVVEQVDVNADTHTMLMQVAKGVLAKHSK